MCAALGDIFSLFSTAAHQGRKVRCGGIGCPQSFGAVVQVHDSLDDIAGLLLIGMPEIIKCFKLCRVTCIRANPLLRISFPGQRVGVGMHIISAGQGQLNGLEQVQVAVDRSRAVIPAHGVFKAAHRGIFMHVALVDQVFHAGFFRLEEHTRHGTLIKIQQKRRTLAVCHHIDHFFHQRFRGPAVQPHIRFGLKNG